MKVIVLGAGQVGYSIARYLSHEDNDVSVVDHSPELLRKIGDVMDVQPVLGHASHPDVLERAGAEQADLVIAVTGSDEVNITACEVVHSLFQVRTKIARIRSQHYLNPSYSNLFSPQHLAIDHIISPESEIATSISRSLQIVGAFSVISLADDTMKSLGLRCPQKAPILNTPLRRMASLFPKLNLSVLCITRGDKVFIPDGDDQLLAGDEIHLLIQSDQMRDVAAAFGFGENQGRRVLIIGAGNVGLSLANILENSESGTLCKIIERNPKQAELAARQLKHSEVLCGDAMDNDVLREANPSSLETVVSVTDDDKVNILSSLLSKRLGSARSMALLNNMGLASFASSLGIDAVINPKSISVSTILQYIRQGRIRAIHSLRDDFAELIDAEARETTMAVGLSVGDINIPGQIMVAALLRDDECLFLPGKSTFIRMNDRLILIATKAAVHKIEKLFALRSGYL